MTNCIQKSCCKTLLFAGLFLASGSALAEEEVPVTKTSTANYSGSLRGSYDYRGLGEYDDSDVYGYWYLRGNNLADKRIDIYTSGRFHQDLDGSGDSYAEDPFISLEDTSLIDSTRVLQLYIDLHDPKKKMALRIGRQYVDIADYIQMDGLQAMLFEKQKIGGRVFLGRPVSYYSSISGDLFGGASLVGTPWEGNRSRVTYARYQDDSEGAADDSFFFDVHQRVAEELRARAYLSIMNEDVRMGGADLFYMSLEEKVLDAQLGIRRWGEYEANSRVYSPLVQSLGALEPYTTAYGRLTTQALTWLYISPGVIVRYPDESNYSNRAYERYDLSFIYEPFQALNASIGLEYWDVEDQDQFFGISGDIRYRYHRLWEVALGAAYLDYTYFQFSDFSLTADGGSTIVEQDGTRIEVSPDAFTYYLRAKWNIGEHVTLRASGELEDDSDEEDYGYRFRTSIEVKL